MEHRIESAIDILMEKEGYFWCGDCAEWITYEYQTPQAHKESRHF